jgi:hypothetical protein
MPKIFIEVRGGMIQNIQCTSPDIEVYVMDYDNFDPNEEDSGWQYWEAKGGDQIVDDETFADAITNANQ